MGEAGNFIPHVFIYRVRLSGSLIPPIGVHPLQNIESGRIQLMDRQRIELCTAHLSTISAPTRLMPAVTLFGLSTFPHRPFTTVRQFMTISVSGNQPLRVRGYHGFAVI